MFNNINKKSLKMMCVFLPFASVILGVVTVDVFGFNQTNATNLTNITIPSIPTVTQFPNTSINVSIIPNINSSNLSWPQIANEVVDYIRLCLLIGAGLAILAKPKIDPSIAIHHIEEAVKKISPRSMLVVTDIGNSCVRTNTRGALMSQLPEVSNILGVDISVLNSCMATIVHRFHEIISQNPINIEDRTPDFTGQEEVENVSLDDILNDEEKARVEKLLKSCINLLLGS